MAAAQARGLAAIWAVRKNVVTARIELYAAQTQLQRAQALEGAQAAILTIDAQRRLAGQLPNPLVSPLRVANQQTLFQIQQNAAAVDLALQHLAAAMGLPPAALQAIAIDTPKNNAEIAELLQRPLPSTQAVQTESLTHNANLAAALADYHAAHTTLLLEVAKQIPDIDLGPAYEWNSQGGVKINLGLTLALPLHNRNEGPIAQADAQRTLAARSVDVVQTELIAALAQAAAELNQAQSLVQLAKTAVRQQALHLAQLHQSLRNPSLAKLPLLYAQVELRTMENAVGDAQIQTLRAWVNWESTLQQPVLGEAFGTSLAVGP